MFENKVRGIIQDLVEPMQDKTNTFIKKSENVLMDLETIGRRVEELEFAMTKVQRQSNDFDGLKNDQDSFKQQIKRKYDVISNEMDGWSRKIGDIMDQNTVNNNNMVRIDSQFTGMKEVFTTSIKDCQNMMKETQDLTLQVKQDCFQEINHQKAKILELEKMNSKVGHL